MRQYHSHSVEQNVEWLYAFDVHANAFFCSFFLTYVVQVNTILLLIMLSMMENLTIAHTSVTQYFLLPVLMSKSILACMASNSLYAASTLWYAYITHLGYRGTALLHLIMYAHCFTLLEVTMLVCYDFTSFLIPLYFYFIFIFGGCEHTTYFLITYCWLLSLFANCLLQSPPIPGQYASIPVVPWSVCGGRLAVISRFSVDGDADQHDTYCYGVPLRLIFINI